MNKDLIKRLIEVKLDVGQELLQHLPSEKADEIRDIGRIALECLNEYSETSKKEYSKRPKNASKKVKNIDIE